MTIFEQYLIAHLIGDYFLQNNYLALNKSRDNIPLAAHSFIYATVFGIMFLNPAVFIVFFLLHYLGDASYGGATLTEKWLRVFGGRSLQSVMNPPIDKLCSADPKALSLYASFSAVVYCVVDFLIHFIIQYPTLIILLKYYNMKLTWFG